MKDLSRWRIHDELMVKNDIDGKESNTAKGVSIATDFNEFKETLFNK